MRKPLTALMLVLFIAGCATVEGAGKDISAAGEVISDTAREVKEDL